MRFSPAARGAIAAIALTAGAVTGIGCGSSSSAATAQGEATASPGALISDAPAYSEDLKGFLTYVGDELNAYWAENVGADVAFEPATVVVPEQSARTACGTIDAANTGPAYCGDDGTMVLPVAFFRDTLIGADDDGTNDAAVAGVVGHEFGHHLQSLIGLEDAISEAAAESPEATNLLSVANELNADCLMGLWLSSVDDEKRLEEGDLGEVLGALERIGDDTLSAANGVEADASAFDHGTAEQRQVWFGVGYAAQDPAACARVFDDLADGTLAQELQQGADQANGETTTP